MASCKRKRDNAEKQLKRISKSFADMLYQDAVQNEYEGTGYMGNIGTIVDVKLTEPTVVTVTIATDDDPPKKIVLCLSASLGELR